MDLLILKKTVVEKLARGAKRHTGGMRVKNISGSTIIVFYKPVWREGISIPKKAENFKRERISCDGEEYIFLLPQEISLIKN